MARGDSLGNLDLIAAIDAHVFERNDGIGTIYRMAGIYGTELKIDRTVIIASIMIVQFVIRDLAHQLGWRKRRMLRRRRSRS